MEMYQEFDCEMKKLDAEYREALSEKDSTKCQEIQAQMDRLTEATTRHYDNRIRMSRAR